MNYFQLFDLPATFELDLTELGSRYLALQRKFHPDKYAAASNRDRLMSVQQTANINDAYHSLKQPLLRAEHLLALRGLKISHEQRSFTDPVFLMQQMELREQLAELSRIYLELQQAGQAERERLAGELTRLNQSKQVSQAYTTLG